MEKQIKVLHLTDEEFDNRIDEDAFFIEVIDTCVHPNDEYKIKMLDDEELLNTINDLVGILNIKECKEFVFTYGERKFEAPSIYNELLVQKLIESDDVTNLPINIVRYYYEDYLDNGIKCKVILGYDVDVTSIDTRLHNGAIINTPLCDVLLQTPINNNGDVEEHQILYNDYGIIIQDKGEFFTQREFWESDIGTDCSDIFPL